ncbi:MAG: MotA/TolQ/ExbB proton channel family protein, partial [Verrucomicrobiota bacterium]
RRRSAHQWADDANVSAWQSAGIGALFFLLFYLVTWPLAKTYFGALFWSRGWVPFALIFLMGWSFGILLLKSIKLRRQKAVMAFDALPMDLGEMIDEQNVETFLDYVDRLPGRLQTSFMVNRIRRGLEHFWLRRSNPEVVDLMNSQSEIDASAIQSSYTTIKVFIWAIPILGFIGTVIGISGAIAGFSGSLDQAEDVKFLVQSINNVTGGLGVAFDTTLVALVMSIIVSFPASSMQKAEEDLLNRIDEYCNENLLKRLDDAGGVADVAIHTERIMESIGEAVTGSQQNVLETLQGIVGQMAEVQEAQVEQANAFREMVQQELSQLSERAADEQERVDTRLAELVKKTEAESRDAMKRNAEVIQHHFAALGEGINALNGVLKNVGEGQVVVQQVREERRRWFERRKK